MLYGNQRLKHFLSRYHSHKTKVILVGSIFTCPFEKDGGFWNTVLWSDETKTELFGQIQAQQVWN